MILKIGKNIILPQWYTGLGVTLLILQLGIMSGWPSPTLARLTALDSPTPLTLEEASWVAALVNIGRLSGAIIGPLVTNYVGSKQSIFYTIFPIAAGWLILVITQEVEWLYVSRIFLGFGLGSAFSTFGLYIGEVSMPQIRGALISMATVGGPFGQIISSVCGSFMSISTAASLYFFLCLILIALFFFLPESPHYLVKIGDHEGAKKSITWYRAGRGVDAELEAVQNFVTCNKCKSFSDQLREFKSPAIRRATFQVIALFTFMQICGLNSIIFYMETILNRAKCTIISPSLAVIYVNVIGTVAAIVSIPLIDKCGRRILLLVSSVGVTLSMFGLMIHFMLINQDFNAADLQWLPIVSMFLFMLSFYFGFMPVPSTVLSETFPANIKCMGACISGLTGAITAFLSAKTYQPMVELMGESYVFLIYAICTIIAIPYTLFIMPETKGKSLQQIQDELIKR